MGTCDGEVGEISREQGREAIFARTLEKYVLPTFNLGRGMNSIIPVRILSRVNTVIGLVSDMLDMVVEEETKSTRFIENIFVFSVTGLWRNVCR